MSQKTLFQDLSPDVLCEITWLLRAQELGRVWICGCKALQTKCAIGGGVRHFELQIFGSQNRLLWPTMVASFPHLEVFALVKFGNTKGSPIQSEHMTQLPATVISLKLQFPGALNTFFGALSPPCAVSLPNLAKLNIKDVGPIRDTPLHWPQTLISLEIETTRSTSVSIDPNTLPQGLTFLSVKYATFKECGSPMPNTITHIDIKTKSVHHSSFVASLPAHLLYLRLLCDTPQLADDWNWLALPRGLETLILPSTNFSRSHYAQLTPSLTKLAHTRPNNSEEWFYDSLPPKIKEAISIIPKEISSIQQASILPRSLEKWSSQEYSTEYADVVAEAIPHLPPHTQFICCVSPTLEGLANELQALNLTSIPLFPRRLTVQTCIGVDSLSVIAPKSSLEFLEIESGPLPRPALEYFADLRTYHLTSLRIIGLTGKDRIPPENWSLLPRTLSTLLMAIPDRLLPTSSADLPRNLVALELHSAEECELHSEWFKTLPASLSWLILARVTSVVSPQTNVQFPHQQESPQNPNLLVNFDFPTRLRRLAVLFGRNVGNWIIPSVVACFPPNLSGCALCLPPGVDSHLTKESLSHLPQSLCNLSLPPSPSLNLTEGQHVNFSGRTPITFCDDGQWESVSNIARLLH